ncbi:MAG: ABC transporter substrate-binding protein [Acidobacteriota bacterium]|nr:ABC transporter substrate-binding protein [Acidobacteriota bacterium]
MRPFALRLISWMLPLLVCIGCIGCTAPAGTGSAGNPSTVRVSILSADPPSLSLLGSSDLNSQRLAVQITDSLVQYDPNMKLVGRLATDWTVSEDGTSITFNLRRDVRWQDGQPFTSRDVLFTAEAVRRPSVANTIFAPQLETLAAIEAPDDYTVVVRYEEGFPDMLEPWRMPQLPAHLAGLDEDLVTGKYAKHPVGCGPFRFEQHIPGQEIVLSANDDYWDGRPSIDRLVFKIYPEMQTAYQALLAGEIDLMPMSPDLHRQARESDRADRWTFDVYHTFSTWLMTWNQTGSNPFFDDPRVRKAMVHALDRDTFIETVLGGHARSGVTTFHPDLVWADPDARPLEYSPETARRLLAEAGWLDHDGDGLLDRDGTPFRFTILVAASTMKLVDHMAAWQQESWKALGIDARIDRLEWQAFRERRNAGEFDLASYTLRFSPNPDQSDLYHSTARESGINYFGLADDELDRHLERARELGLDDDQRRAILHQVQRRLQALEPVTCLFYFATPLVYDRHLQGVKTTPLGLVETTAGPRHWRWSEVDGE